MYACILLSLYWYRSPVWSDKYPCRVFLCIIRYNIGNFSMYKNFLGTLCIAYARTLTQENFQYIRSFNTCLILVVVNCCQVRKFDSGHSCWWWPTIRRSWEVASCTSRHAEANRWKQKISAENLNTLTLMSWSMHGWCACTKSVIGKSQPIWSCRGAIIRVLELVETG
jgi:hypothetical protein